MRPVSARIAVRSSDFRASMKLSTQPGQVESVVVFVAKIVTTTLPSNVRLGVLVADVPDLDDALA